MALSWNVILLTNVPKSSGEMPSRWNLLIAHLLVFVLYFLQRWLHIFFSGIGGEFIDDSGLARVVYSLLVRMWIRNGDEPVALINEMSELFALLDEVLLLGDA